VKEVLIGRAGSVYLRQDGVAWFVRVGIDHFFLGKKLWSTEFARFKVSDRNGWPAGMKGEDMGIGIDDEAFENGVDEDELLAGDGEVEPEPEEDESEDEAEEDGDDSDDDEDDDGEEDEADDDETDDDSAEDEAGDDDDDEDDDEDDGEQDDDSEE
jgi:hypothetical protein